MALVRKYCDSIILDIYKTILEKELRDKVLENMSIESIKNNEITNWIDAEGRLFDEKRMKIVYGKISEYYPELTYLFKLKNSDTLFHKLKEVCNDNMHNNYLYTMMANDAEMIKLREDLRMPMINNVSKSIRFFFSIHFAFIYCGDALYMMSSDYIDHLDCDFIPPEGSERWVAPAVISAFEIARKTVPKVADYLISLDIMDL